jgi:hypothetical protein
MNLLLIIIVPYQQREEEKPVENIEDVLVDLEQENIKNQINLVLEDIIKL